MDISDDETSVNEFNGREIHEGSDDLEGARQRIEKDKYDDAWKILLNDAQNRPIEEARQVYEEFLQIFPTAARVWKIYIEAEIKAGNSHTVKALLAKCKDTCLNVDFWKTYLKYIINRILQETDPQNHSVMIISAYEHAISKVGLDIDAYNIWMDYIRFLKKESSRVTDDQESFLKDKIREVFQRAINVPMHHLDELWKEYDEFEHTRDKTSSKKIAQELLKEFRLKYQLANDAYKERKKYIEVLSKNVLPRPPRGLAKEHHQVKLWRSLIEFEKSTQKFDPEDVNQRVIFTFEKALMELYHYPEIWHLYASYMLDTMGGEKCKEVYTRALKVLSNSLLLHFQYCDFLELGGNYAEADEVYKKIIETKPEPLVWIQYLFFSRRVYNIHGARKIFFKARKSLSCTYHIYVASALLEYYVNKDEAVSKSIFELGLKRYSQEPSFLYQYIQFLQYKNDSNDIHTLFDTISASNRILPYEMWNLFVKYDKLMNNYSRVKGLLQRRTESKIKNDSTGIHDLVQQFKFLDLWPSTKEEMSTFVEPDEIEEVVEEEMEKEKQEDTKTFTLIMPDKAVLDIYKREVHAPQVQEQKIDPLVNLLRILPNPSDWDGPYINVDRMVVFLRDIHLPYTANSIL